MTQNELLGEGDLTGRIVNYWGKQWIISGKNSAGDWNLLRFKTINDQQTRCQTIISAYKLPVTHQHHAKLLPKTQ